MVVSIYVTAIDELNKCIHNLNDKIEKYILKGKEDKVLKYKIELEKMNHQCQLTEKIIKKEKKLEKAKIKGEVELIKTIATEIQKLKTELDMLLGNGNNDDSISSSGKRKIDEVNIEENHSLTKKLKLEHNLGVTVSKKPLPVHKYILAPMVGGSELAFRMLCRNYGAELCYTPMMNSELFATDSSYRSKEFQTNDQDRPLVCHFSGNDPDIMLRAAKLVEDKCDAIDLNLGCPQRIAHAGHFGSYLLDPKDRKLILSIVRKLSTHLSIPVFCKIRLLDTLEDTIELAKQLEDAGCDLLAIHARFRVNLVGRTGAGARDGAAKLDFVREVKKRLRIPVIANGNVITFQDLITNMEFTGADGIMTAEGILDDPAIFNRGFEKDSETFKQRRKLEKKMREIEQLEQRDREGIRLNSSEVIKVNKRKEVEEELNKLPPLAELKVDKKLKDKIGLALEYLSYAKLYPVKMKSIIFHIRRMMKDELTDYQLMTDCTSCNTLEEVENIVKQCASYKEKNNFVYDPLKEQKMKEAIERRKWEEGKRKRFEERMTRKAKREGKDPHYYISLGAMPPTIEKIEYLKTLSKDKQFEIWKCDHSQHCYGYHLNVPRCDRDRTCAFLHSDAIGGGESGSDPSWLEENTR